MIDVALEGGGSQLHGRPLRRAVIDHGRATPKKKKLEAEPGMFSHLVEPRFVEFANFSRLPRKLQVKPSPVASETRLQLLRLPEVGSRGVPSGWTCRVKLTTFRPESKAQ